MADSIALFDSSGDSLRTLTYSSVPLAAIDAPEPREVVGVFVYKFFTPNEREEYAGGGGTVPSNGSDEVSTAAAGSTSSGSGANDRRPRYIRLSFRQPVAEVEATTKSSVADFLGRGQNLLTLIRTGYLHIEDSVSSDRFQRAQITSADLDLKAVSFLTAREDEAPLSVSFDAGASPILQESLGELSSRISLAIAGTRGGAPAGLAADAAQAENDAAVGRVIVNYINSSGQAKSRINYYSRESREQVERTADVVSSRQETLAINRLVYDDVILASSCNVNNLLHDEVRDHLSKSGTVQEKARQKSKTSGISASSNEIIVKPFSASPVSGFRIYRSILLGYIVEKLEINAGNIIEHPSYLIEGSRQTSMIDTRVNYGAMYKYRVRAIFLREMQITFEKSGELGVAKVLVASSGESAECFVSSIEEIPPPEVADFLITYDYEEKSNRLSWSLPVNSQKDIKYFQVFRRERLNRPYRLLHVIDFDDSTIREPARETYSRDVVERVVIVKSVFMDRQVEQDKEYFYAICCVDAHGLTSGYSMQMGAKFSRAKNRIVTRHISRAGAPKTYPNLYLETDTFADVVRIKGASLLHTIFDPESLKIVYPGGKTEEATGESTFTISIINETNCTGDSINIKSSALLNAEANQQSDLQDPDVTVEREHAPSVSGLFGLLD